MRRPIARKLRLNSAVVCKTTRERKAVTEGSRWQDSEYQTAPRKPTEDKLYVDLLNG